MAGKQHVHTDNTRGDEGQMSGREEKVGGWDEEGNGVDKQVDWIKR